MYNELPCKGPAFPMTVILEKGCLTLKNPDSHSSQGRSGMTVYAYSEECTVLWWNKSIHFCLLAPPHLWMVVQCLTSWGTSFRLQPSHSKCCWVLKSKCGKPKQPPLCGWTILSQAGWGGFGWKQKGKHFLAETLRLYFAVWCPFYYFVPLYLIRLLYLKPGDSDSSMLCYHRVNWQYVVRSYHRWDKIPYTYLHSHDLIIWQFD